MSSGAETSVERPDYGGLSEEAFMVGSDIHQSIRQLDSRDDRLGVIPHLLEAASYEVMGDDCTVEEVDAMVEAARATTERLETYRRSIENRQAEAQRRATEFIDE